MADKVVIRTDRAPGPFQGAPYHQAIRVGDLVFVAGQLGIALETGELAGPTVGEQTEQVMQNLAVILEAAGSGLDSWPRPRSSSSTSRLRRHERGARAPRRNPAALDRRYLQLPSGLLEIRRSRKPERPRRRRPSHGVTVFARTLHAGASRGSSL
jgi:hypothetical protein